MKAKTKLFWILWTAGMLGVLSFLVVDLEALIRAVPLPEGTPPVELPPAWLFKIVSLIQPTVIVTVAVLVGVGLASRVGLHAPAAEAAANGEPFLQRLKPQIVPGVIAGLLSGSTIVLSWVVAKPYFTNEFIERAEEFNKLLPALTRFLFGGFTEEILLRWGFMTFLVWAAWRLFQKGIGEPKAVYVIAAIIVSALVFGMGHLPLASMLAGGLSVPLVIYVITANSILGVAAGFLYWRRGLESAIIAHISAHVVLISAIYLAF
ncbi:MAG: CPBP family intramembrane glutamic endopeptidase [Pyrinomonadaceae bacterium]